MIIMSIQSDVEMLSIQALEYYAKKHNITEEKHLVFFINIKYLKKFWYSMRRFIS